MTSRLVRCQTGAARLEALELQIEPTRALKQGSLAEAGREYGRTIVGLPFVTAP
ncbi:MAG TPA: hypothetical protein VF774_28370 [Pseudoduganella sp.]